MLTMAPSRSYLFVYGTLLDKQNKFGAYLSSNCIFYVNGKMRGKLYDIGEYPGAILNIESKNYVFGKIYELIDVEKVLKLLDDYEGFGPDQLQPNLFVRQLIAIETAIGGIECWVYLYNLPVEGLKLIESGKYFIP